MKEEREFSRNWEKYQEASVEVPALYAEEMQPLLQLHPNAYVGVCAVQIRPRGAHQKTVRALNFVG